MYAYTSFLLDNLSFAIFLLRKSFYFSCRLSPSPSSFAFPLTLWPAFQSVPFPPSSKPFWCKSAKENQQLSSFRHHGLAWQQRIERGGWGTRFHLKIVLPCFKASKERRRKTRARKLNFEKFKQIWNLCSFSYGTCKLPISVYLLYLYRKWDCEDVIWTGEQITKRFRELIFTSQRLRLNFLTVNIV